MICRHGLNAFFLFTCVSVFLDSSMTVSQNKDASADHMPYDLKHLSRCQAYVRSIDQSQKENKHGYRFVSQSCRFWKWLLLTRKLWMESVPRLCRKCCPSPDIAVYARFIPTLRHYINTFFYKSPFCCWNV